MRRADRLFQIVQFLGKRRRAVTAQTIAESFGICTRTLYRDIQDLMASGVPIVGEAGVGYILDRNYQLPPLMLDVDELESIALGISMVRSWTDDRFAERAAAALRKIEAALPAPLVERLQQLALLSMPSRSRPPWTVSFSSLRECILQRRKVRFCYRDEHGKDSERTVRPLALVFFGPVWLLVAWCESRKDFRSFRLDRMRDAQYLSESFPEEADKSLARYMSHSKDCQK
jgi:predicted DNA-binding transcriptional regulator YafY